MAGKKRSEVYSIPWRMSATTTTASWSISGGTERSGAVSHESTTVILFLSKYRFGENEYDFQRAATEACFESNVKQTIDKGAISIKRTEAQR